MVIKSKFHIFSFNSKSYRKSPISSNYVLQVLIISIISLKFWEKPQRFLITYICRLKIAPDKLNLYKMAGILCLKALSYPLSMNHHFYHQVEVESNACTVPPSLEHTNIENSYATSYIFKKNLKLKYKSEVKSNFQIKVMSNLNSIFCNPDHI